MKRPVLSLPLATALKSSLSNYNFPNFYSDAIAGFVVSLIALPLAMALSIAVGLPPQHGIYTAIVAGIAAAVLGGSKVQVSGPTAAFVVIVAPIVSEHGLHGLIWCEMMAGLVLIIMGAARFGRFINFVPYPVTTGFTAGIAVVIATLALNDFFGLGIAELKGDYIEKVAVIVTHLPNFNSYELLIGAASLLTFILFANISRAMPSAIIGVMIGTGLAYLLSRYGISISTIGSRFTYETAYGIQHGIPPYPPRFHLPGENALFSIPSYAEFRSLLTPSLVIAALAALESLLSATVADSMAGTRHNPNAELGAIGISNILSGLVAGIPATGAIARTSVNIHSGAKTPFAAVIHGVLIMLYVLFFVRFINLIPMAALSALLLNTAYRMSHAKQFVRTIKIAPLSDTLVLLTCFGFTVFIDMVAGVTIGIVLASFLFMKRMSELTQINLNATFETTQEDGPPPLPDDVMIYRIDGPLFFGTVEKAYDSYNFTHDHIRTLIIDLRNVPLIDMTGLVAMKSMLASITREGRQVVLCGRKDVTDSILYKMSDHPARKYIKTVVSINEALASASEKLP
jgi:SulP family sulfate permease